MVRLRDALSERRYLPPVTELFVTKLFLNFEAKWIQWGGRIRGSKLDIGIAAERRQIEQNFVLTCIGKSWMGGLSVGANPNPLMLP